jgi:hypothetical protein
VPPGERLLLRLDVAGQKPFRIRSGLTQPDPAKTTKVYNLLSKTGANPPAGWTGRCANIATQMEFFADEQDRPALAIRNVKGPGSAMLFTPKFVCPSGVCRLVVEYQAPMGGGKFRVRFKPDNAAVWDVARPESGGDGWRTFDQEVALRGATGGYFEFHNGDGSPDAVLRVRSVTVTEVRGAGAAAPPAPPVAADKPVYRLDLKAVAPFRVTKEGFKRISGDAEKLPPGVGCGSWKQGSVGEFRCEEVDGAPALGVTNLNDQVSGQFAFELEKAIGLSLEAGKTYRVKVEYLTRNEAAGHFTVGTLEYKSVASAPLKNTGEAWRTAEATFTREEDVPVRLTVDNMTVGEGNTLLFRSVELTEVP